MKKYIFAALSIYLGLFLAFALVEGFFQLNAQFYWLNTPLYLRTELPTHHFSGPPRFADPFKELGQTKISNQRVKHTYEELSPGVTLHRADLLPSHRNIFTVEYRQDSHKRRITPGAPIKADKFIAMMGCSFMFGFGLNDNQTLPAYIQKFYPDRHIYNLGKGGLGPNDYLAGWDGLNDVSSRFEGISEPNGIAIYMMAPAHYLRAVCSVSCFYDSDEKASDLSQKISYAINPDTGKLEARGSFKDLQIFKYKIYKWLAKSKTIQFFDRYYVAEPVNESKDFIAILDRLKTETEKRLKTDKFLFVNLYKGDTRDWLEDEAKKRNWNVLSVSLEDILTMTDGADLIPYEGHPSPQRNWLLSKLITAKLKELNW